MEWIRVPALCALLDASLFCNTRYDVEQIIKVPTLCELLDASLFCYTWTPVSSVTHVDDVEQMEWIRVPTLCALLDASLFCYSGDILGWEGVCVDKVWTSKI